MKTKDFFDMVVEERIAMILGQKEMVREVEWIAQAEEMMKNVDAKQKNSLLAYINRLINEVAVSERKLYLDGVKDGIWIAGLVLQYLKLPQNADPEHIL